MDDLLFLAHRIPFPPNKGDKIRSFNLLKYLTGLFRVHLGTFVDDKKDWRYVPKVMEMCEQTCFIPLNPGIAKLRSLSGFLNGQPLTMPYYRNSAMTRWVRDLLAKGDVDKVLVFSSAMAQYVEGCEYGEMHRVLDFVDVDSDKWKQYAEEKTWPLSSIYRRESRKLFDYERKYANEFDESLFVTEAEADLFQKQAPETGKRLRVLRNGVDMQFFSPDQELDNPYESDHRMVVFTGAMDYWANVNAVTWFGKKIFPIVRASLPDTRFFVVGARPTSQVMELGKQPGVYVTGSVSDIRPFLKYADVSVAPMCIARGVQNKVLEAMAMKLPVVGTSLAFEGMDISSEDGIRIEDETDKFAKQVIEILMDSQKKKRLAEIARRYIEKHYRWEDQVRLLDDYFRPNRKN